MVVHIKSDKAFLQHYKIANQKKRYMIAKFSSKLCGPCRAIQSDYELLDKNTKNTYCMVVDVDLCLKTTMKYQVRHLPSFIMIKDGVLKKVVRGADRNGLKKMFDSCKK